MSCPSCSLQIVGRRLPQLIQRAAALSSLSSGGFLSAIPQHKQILSPEVKQNEVGLLGLRKFVENITKKPKEARLWMKYFQIFSAKSPGKAFAVMQITPEVFYDMASVRKLAWSAAFLFENNLLPLIVCQLVTDVDWSNVELLRALLGKHGVPSSVTIANDDAAASYLHDVSNSHLPIVCCPKLDRSANGMHRVTVRLCSMLRPLKVMLLSKKHGLKDASGRVMSDILLPTDLETLLNGKTHLNFEDQTKVLQSAELLKHLSCESSVIITSPDTVVQELFTHHGSGTMIRQSEKILNFPNLDEVDKTALASLICDSFRKKLSSKYFERVQHLVETVYVSERCNAGAIILRLPNVSVPYLDKIAVSEAAQGNGISVMLWNQITKDYPQLFWRSKTSNKAAIAWYNTVSQGSWKTDQGWTIFWYGLKYSHHLTELIEYAQSKSTDFKEV